MSKTLNDAQRKLVEDNHDLIYSFLNSNKLCLDAVDDWYGTAAIGLCKAAMMYDENEGTRFDVLAYVCMGSEVLQVKKKNRENITPIASLDEEIASTDNGCLLGDTIPDQHDFFLPVYVHDAINIALRDMGDRDRQIVNLIVNEGLTNDVIAAKLGITQATIAQVYGKFIGKIRDYFND